MSKRLPLLGTTMISCGLLLATTIAILVSMNATKQLTPSAQMSSPLLGSWTLGDSTLTFNLDGTGTARNRKRTHQFIWADENGTVTMQVIGAKGPQLLELIAGRLTEVLTLDSADKGSLRLTNLKNGESVTMISTTTSTAGEVIDCGEK